jgi:hypothetical protein
MALNGQQMIQLNNLNDEFTFFLEHDAVSKSKLDSFSKARAAILCSIRNVTKELEELNSNLASGGTSFSTYVLHCIPDSMFANIDPLKKERRLRFAREGLTHALVNEKETERTTNQNKLQDNLNNLYESLFIIFKDKVQITKRDLTFEFVDQHTMDNILELSQRLEVRTNELLPQMINRQRSHLKSQEEKKAKLLAKKEAEEAPVTITVKQLNQLQKAINYKKSPKSKGPSNKANNKKGKKGVISKN